MDVGINPVTDETGRVRLVGDFDFASVAERAAGISPVPGGVGPITDVWLLHNTVAVARLAAGVADAQCAVDAGPLTRAWGDAGVAAATGPRAAR